MKLDKGQGQNMTRVKSGLGYRIGPLEVGLDGNFNCRLWLEPKILISEANGITDEDLELEELSMDPESWTPAIHLYYNDDHTVG